MTSPFRCAALIVLVVAGPSAAQQPQQVQVPTAQSPPATKAPLPNRLNEVLPAWLRVRGEFRERVEGFENAGFDAAGDDVYALSRFRFNAMITPSPVLSFEAQVQDARVGRKTVGPTGTPFKAPFDLRMGFADIGGARSRVSVRVGRQELVYGEQRLVGHVSWLNAARTFDGVKVTIRTPAAQVEAFGTSVVRILDDQLDKSGNGNRFAGAYAATTRLVPNASLEPYFFWRRDVIQRSEQAVLGDLSSSTLGVRLAGRLPWRLDYGVEMAAQRGSLGPDDIDTWAGHWQLRTSLPGAGAVKLTTEYNYAAGDDNPVDGVRGTFDQLYPTPHDKYGLADQFGWKNIRHARVGVEFAPVRALPVTANYHSWWLADKHDGVYTAGGALLARVIGGAASSHVGQELDVQVARALTPQIQAAAGYAHIFTGSFLEQATPGASYSYPYVMVTYVFLAER